MHKYTENLHEPQAMQQLFSNREAPLMYVVTMLTPGPPSLKLPVESTPVLVYVHN